MESIKNQFEKGVKAYEGQKAKLLVVANFTRKLQEELPNHFINWLNPELTGTAVIAPISEIKIEVDSQGYLYSSLFNKNGKCMVSEGSSPDLFDWGLVSVNEGEYEFENRQSLVAQFLALCYKSVLAKVCETTEFLNLPREEKIVFSVGAHSGWTCDDLYVYEGERFEIDYGNIRLKQLHNAASCHTEIGTVENRFIKHLKQIDVRKYADELIPVFEKFLLWLTEQEVKPLDRIIIAWSSNFNRVSAFGGVAGETVYRWPSGHNFSRWFSTDRPENLDAEECTRVRYAVSNKIAEIACLATEYLVEVDLFNNLPKNDRFIMRIQNRTAGSPPLFYPFD